MNYLPLGHDIFSITDTKWSATLEAWHQFGPYWNSKVILVGKYLELLNVCPYPANLKAKDLKMCLLWVWKNKV